jgi:malonyl-CoA O-methyltransferase
MREPAFPDKRAAQRAFERNAATYDAHAVLQREVGARLLAHLDPIRIDPARIVDLGCGTGGFLPELARRFPRAGLVGVDFARPMLRAARGRTPAWRRALGRPGPRLVCADAEQLPLANGSAQFVFANLLVQWVRPERAFAEVSRVLATGGLFLFSTYGPDTLKELRGAFAAVDGGAHVHTFIDMHDVGDALVHAGLADPVMEAEGITVEYASVEALLRDLKQSGAQNALPGRARGLVGRKRWQRVVERYEALRRDAALPATYEVVYGHAWKTAPRSLPDGRRIIEFHGHGAP